MQIRRFNQQNGTELNQVFQIQKAAYTVEARILGASDFPPLHGTLQELASSSDESFVVLISDLPRGAIFLEKTSTFILISKLIVSPEFFRQGIARALIRYCLELYPQTEFQVGTGVENEPALQLYRSFDFHVIGESLFEGHLKLCKLQRTVSAVY